MANPRSVSTLPIAAVERDSGLSKDTLRVWERRYGFPAPLRDQHGERIYPQDQVVTLRHLRRLVDAGHRPGRIVGRPAEEIAALAHALEDLEPETPEARTVLGLMTSNQADALQAYLKALLADQGLRHFMMRTVPAIVRAVGVAWQRGEIEIHQEHLFTEQLTAVSRAAILSIAHGPLERHPTILLATIPGEPHALGLLMVETLFTLAGCRCIGLGVQTPIAEVAAAARAHRADVVALSFSSYCAAADAQAGLIGLRAALDPEVEIWAGGACSGLRARPGIRLVRALDAVEQEVAKWRGDHQEGSAR